MNLCLNIKVMITIYLYLTTVLIKKMNQVTALQQKSLNTEKKNLYFGGGLDWAFKYMLKINNMKIITVFK